MDVLLSSTLDDPGYGSAEESDRQPEGEIPPPRRRLSRSAHLSGDADREIALYDQRHSAQMERAKGETHTDPPKDLNFFPPHSNDNPRTSLQVQQHEEYSKPLYQTSDDFRRMSVIRSSQHAGHVGGSLRSSGAIHHGKRFSDQGQHHTIGSGSHNDAKRLEIFPARSHDQSSDSAAPTLRSIASSASSSRHSSFLTPVKRRILNVVQIPRVDTDEASMALGTDGKMPEDDHEKELRNSVGNENEALMDSYDAHMTAGGGGAERKGQHSDHDSRDSMRVMLLRGLRSLRYRRGDSKLIKIRR